MSITADQDAASTTAFITQHLNLSDSALVCNRRTIEADLANPARAIYKRQRLYETVLKVLLAEPAGRRVLDYRAGPACRR